MPSKILISFGQTSFLFDTRMRENLLNRALRLMARSSKNLCNDGSPDIFFIKVANGFFIPNIKSEMPMPFFILFPE